MCPVFQGTVNSYQGARQYCSADFQSAVSRISNPQKVVLVRTPSRLEAGDTAGWKPALQDSTAIAPHSEFERPQSLVGLRSKTSLNRYLACPDARITGQDAARRPVPPQAGSLCYERSGDDYDKSPPPFQ